MAHFAKTIMLAIISWMTAQIIVYVSYNIFAPIITTLTSIDAAENAAFYNFLTIIGWLSLIIIWVITAVIIPSYMIIKAASEEEGGLSTIIAAIVFWIFGIIYVVMQYQYLGSFATLVTTVDGHVSTFLAIIFWTSTILTWVSALFIAPTYLIMKGYQGKKIEAKQNGGITFE